MELTDGEPLFLADWTDVVMAHFEVDPERLQRLTPFTLDLFHGRAFVSLVVFRMDRMRLRILPGFTEPLFAPFTRSWFLNLRTYVRHGDETGIQFLVEWLSNRLSVPFGGPVYGLPYRAGHFDLRDHFGVRQICVKPLEASILGATFPELSDARLIGATCSAGVNDVWMGRPQLVS